MLEKFNKTEKFFMVVMLIIIGIWTFGDYEQFKNIIEKLSNSYFFVVAVLYTGLTIWKCPSKALSIKKSYSPETYSELQSKKVTYSLYGILFSLGAFISAAASNDTKVGAFLLGIDILLLSSISYRHLTYAIYMQEAKKRLYDICSSQQKLDTKNENE